MDQKNSDVNVIEPAFLERFSAFFLWFMGWGLIAFLLFRSVLNPHLIRGSLGHWIPDLLVACGIGSILAFVGPLSVLMRSYRIIAAGHTLLVRRWPWQGYRKYTLADVEKCEYAQRRIAGRHLVLRFRDGKSFLLGLRDDGLDGLLSSLRSSGLDVK